MMVRDLGLLALVTAIVACGPAMTAPPTTVARQAAPATTAEKKPPVLLLPPLPLGATPNANWLDMTTAGGNDEVLDRATAVPPPKPDTYGMKAALYKKYAVHEDFGVVGPITLPGGHTYVGLDGEDAVWVGTPGAFMRAADVRAASKGTFASILRAPTGAALTAFTATKGLVAATDGKSLFISRNKGRTFETHVYETIRTILDIAARPDGAMVIVGRDAKDFVGIWLARWGDNPTRTLVESNFDYGDPKLATHGSELHVAGCPPVALAADGTRWFTTEDDLEHEDLAAAWLDPLVISDRPNAFEPKHRTLVEPKAPAKGAVTKTIFQCQGVSHGFGRIGQSKRGTVLRDCAFAECLVGTTDPAPIHTATRAAFYSDGACQEGAADDCRTWKRAPQVWHSRVPEPLTIPKGCLPDQLISAGGIGVLVCKGEQKLSLHTLDKAGVFHSEGDVPLHYVRHLSIADDGTIMITEGCAKAPCTRVAVRMPRPLGDASAWRMVSHAGGTPPPLTHRVLRGGNVLFATGSGSKMSLWIDRPAQPPLAFVQDIELPASVIDIVVKADRIVLSTVKTATWVLTDQGLAAP
jgi:hypothetical protein